MFSYLWRKISGWTFGHALTETHLENSKDESSQKTVGEGKHQNEEMQEYNIKIKTSPPTWYYGVSLPAETLSSLKEKDDKVVMVFDDQKRALEMVTKYKGARFKRFPSLNEADEFSQSDSSMSRSICHSPRQITSEVSNAEKSLFKGPKPTDLMAFRKLIERGEVAKVKELMWSNPRYIVSSGDTPVILQEGFRYTAMHIAAKTNHADICRLVMETLQDTTFLRTLYPEDTPQISGQRQDQEGFRYTAMHIAAKTNHADICRLVMETLQDTTFLRTLYPEDTPQISGQRQDQLIDFYLNLPDGAKANNETCLHFASKFGQTEVVRYLLSHPKMDRSARNKYQETAEDIACSRCNGAKTKEDMLQLFQGHAMVPLLRSDDDSIPPVIGSPQAVIGDTIAHQLCASVRNDSHHASPRGPVLVVKAYAGPMSPANARSFHNQWRTSPCSPDRGRQNIRREDYDRGEERIARELAHQMKLPWSEYWGFLEAFADLSTPDGLTCLEKYFHKTWQNAESNRESENCATTTSLNYTPIKTRPTAFNFEQGYVKHVNDMNMIKTDDVFINGDQNGIEIVCTCAKGNDDKENFNVWRNNYVENVGNVCEFCGGKIAIKYDSQSITNDVETLTNIKSPDVSVTNVLSPRTDQMFTDLCTDLDRCTLESPSNVRVGSNGDVMRVFSDDNITDDNMGESFDGDKSHSLPSSPMFIHGTQATKVDLDVYRAIGGTTVDSNLYPCVHKWVQLVMSYNSDAQHTWPSPARVKLARRHSVPQSPLITPTSPVQRGLDGTTHDLIAPRIKLFAN